jgi:hypothetical protein
MAGGYKLWSTGEVVTATNLQNYIQNQTVMVFASASARTTALSGVLAEGMISYRTDSHVLEIYNGTAWVAATPLTTKGDLATFDTAATRLPVGADGSTLVANSSATTGLSWSPSFSQAAGKNTIINGGFDIFQRGTSSTSSGWTCADRWYNIVGGTTTFSQDTSVPTSIGVQYSYKWTTGASSSYGQFYTAFESATVKPLRGQAMVFSFWMKTTGTAYTGTLSADVEYSNSTDAYASQTTAVSISGSGAGFTPTSTWTKYQVTFTVPSDAVGMKIGIVPSSVQASGVVAYLAAAQLELGTVATAFSRAGGTIQGELAACQYYFERVGGNAINGAAAIGWGTATGTGTAQFVIPCTKKRTDPSVSFNSVSGFRVWDFVNSAPATTAMAGVGASATYSGSFQVSCSAPGLTQYRPYFLIPASGAISYIDVNSEL